MGPIPALSLEQILCLIANLEGKGFAIAFEDHCFASLSVLNAFAPLPSLQCYGAAPAKPYGKEELESLIQKLRNALKK